MSAMSDAQRIAAAVDVLGVTYVPEGVGIWLYGRQDAFDGRCPLDMLRAGDIRAFEQAVRSLDTWDDLHADDPKDWPMPEWMQEHGNG